MFGQDRTQFRRFFAEAWRKRREGAPMEPLERLVAEVIALHPEYHRLLEDPERAIERDFPPEAGHTNPFLHLGMHISIREQAATDRPAGIADLRRRLALLRGDEHAAEHQMMECLGQALWEAQRANRAPDEAAYLECLRRHAGLDG